VLGRDDRPLDDRQQVPLHALGARVGSSAAVARLVVDDDLVDLVDEDDAVRLGREHGLAGDGLGGDQALGLSLLDERARVGDAHLAAVAVGARRKTPSASTSASTSSASAAASQQLVNAHDHLLDGDGPRGVVQGDTGERRAAPAGGSSSGRPRCTSRRSSSSSCSSRPKQPGGTSEPSESPESPASNTTTHPAQ